MTTDTTPTPVTVERLRAFVEECEQRLSIARSVGGKGTTMVELTIGDHLNVYRELLAARETIAKLRQANREWANAAVSPEHTATAQQLRCQHCGESLGGWDRSSSKELACEFCGKTSEFPALSRSPAVKQATACGDTEGLVAALNQAETYCDTLAKYVRHHSTCAIAGSPLPIALAFDVGCTCGASDALAGAALAATRQGGAK